MRRFIVSEGKIWEMVGREKRKSSLEEIFQATKEDTVEVRGGYEIREQLKSKGMPLFC